MRYRHSITTALLLSVLLITACSRVGQDLEQEVAEEQTTPIAQETPASGEDEQAESPLAQPESPLAFESPLDTNAEIAVAPYAYSLEYDEPDSDRGHVIGRLVAETPNARIFLAGQLYLGSIIYGTAEVQDAYLSVDVGSAPQADERNDLEEFVFLNIEPGQYGFVIYTPVSPFVAPNPTGDDVLIFEVKPGEVTDIGEVVIP